MHMTQSRLSRTEIRFLTSIMLASLMLAQPHGADPAAQEQVLPKIAPAPDFALTSQDRAPVKLSDYRGRVVAVTFIFTLCADTCPVLTPMMSFVQDQLGEDCNSAAAAGVELPTRTSGCSATSSLANSCA